MQYQCFKYLLYILSQTGSHVYGTQIFLIHLIRNELVGNLCLIKQPGCICLVDFIFFHHKL
ncbi:unknown [Bacteroides stercoris CAG:120]|nr:unknown [Bacteroides stercoris CAG:120]